MTESPRCNLCQSVQNDIIIRNVQNKETNLVQCRTCGFRFFSPRVTWETAFEECFSDKNAKGMQDEAESLYHKGVFFGEPLNGAKVAVTNVESYYGMLFDKMTVHSALQTTKVFEAGCSIGRFLHVCHSKKGIKAENLHGVDINKFAIDIAREKYGLANTHCCDFLKYETSVKFDLVVMLDYIEHTFFPRDDIFKAYNMLNDNGLIAIKTFLEDLDDEHTMMLPPYHAGHFYGDVLYKLLRQTGFRVLMWEVENAFSQVFIVAKKCRVG